MSTDAIVTIGLPVYNSAHTVLETIRSVFAQTYEQWRLVIVDDASTDGTADLLEQITDERVTLVRGTQNLGLATRLNEIAERTTTPLLARLDADDVNDPRRLEIQVAYLTAHPEIDFITSDGIRMDDRSRPYGYWKSIPSPTLTEYFMYGPYLHPAVTGRTEWFRAHPYDATLLRAEDQELWLRTLGDRTTVVQEIPLLYYRDAGNISADKFRRSIDATKVVIRRHAPGHLSPWQTRTQLTLAESKARIYSWATRLGLGDRLISLTGRKLDAAELRRAYETLARVQLTPVPGLDAEPRVGERDDGSERRRSARIPADQDSGR